MTFKIDENLPASVADLLQNAGHNAQTVLDQHLGGCSDAAIARICAQERRTIITLDTDFADIRTYPPANFPGIIVLRLARQDRVHVLDIVQRLIPSLSSEPITGTLWIVDEQTIRIRS